MSQSLAKIYLHLVFSTKNRQPILHDEVRNSLHRYLPSVLGNLGCHVVSINSVEDHVYILFELARTVAVSKVVEDAKKSSSKWLKTQSGVPEDFAWQSGYGVFSVSASNVPAVQDYVRSQGEHHRRHSFQDELRARMVKHGIEYEERYVWE